MSLILDGTNGLSDVDGTAAAPAIRGTDANTGIFFPAADTIAFATAGTEAMRIDSSGNLTIKDKIQFGTDAQTAIQAGGTSDVDLIVAADTNLRFETGTNERARIDSSGNLLVGTTSQTPGYGNTNTGQQLGGSSVSTFSRSATDFVIVCNQNTVDGSTYYQMQFRVSNVSKGSITSTSSATSYNTSSDYRLKNTIAPMTGALDKVALLKPCTYKWNVDGSDGQGFIAHELQAVLPDAVTGEKDAVDGKGNIKPQGIDTSFLVATLTAAIQEQQALITALTTRITALEAA